DITSLSPGNTYDFELDIKYMDIWLGDIAVENNLRLAHHAPNHRWMVYGDMLSVVNIGDDNIQANLLNSFGSFSGLENGSILSAFVQTHDKTVMCTGSSALLTAEPQTGDYYKWFRNGLEITGASGANATSYTATQQG